VLTNLLKKKIFLYSIEYFVTHLLMIPTSVVESLLSLQNKQNKKIFAFSFSAHPSQTSRFIFKGGTLPTFLYKKKQKKTLKPAFKLYPRKTEIQNSIKRAAVQ